MTDLEHSTKELLELGREGDDPSDEAVDHLRRRLAVKLSGAAVGIGAATGIASSAAAKPGASILGKSILGWQKLALGQLVLGKLTLGQALLGGALLVGGATLGIRTLIADTPGSPSTPPLMAAQHDQAPDAPRLDAPAAPPSNDNSSSSQEARPLAPAPSPSVKVAPSPHRPAASASDARANTPSQASAADPTRSIQRELQLIRAAQQHLHRNETQAALTLLAEHAHHFPRGVLSQEREASRVLALCQIGAAHASSQAKRFLERAPSSPFAERVRLACELDDP